MLPEIRGSSLSEFDLSRSQTAVRDAKRAYSDVTPPARHVHLEVLPRAGHGKLRPASFVVLIAFSQYKISCLKHISCIEAVIPGVFSPVGVLNA